MLLRHVYPKKLCTGEPLSLDRQTLVTSLMATTIHTFPTFSFSSALLSAMITLKFTTRDVLGLIQMLCMALVLISETSHNLTIQIHWDNTVILSQN